MARGQCVGSGPPLNDMNELDQRSLANFDSKKCALKTRSTRAFDMRDSSLPSSCTARAMDLFEFDDNDRRYAVLVGRAGTGSGRPGAGDSSERWTRLLDSMARGRWTS